MVHCEWYNSSLVDDRGKLRSIQSLVLDVSARTEAEAGLRRLNTELEQFAYAVSHDLQEPLRNIIIFSDLLRRRTGAELSADAARDLGFVVAGAHQINHLLTGLRSYLQITQQTAAAEHADAVGVLQQVLASLESRIARENATVTAADLPAVAVSSVHLYQLFQNLIANALKFRSSNPPAISVTAQPDGSMIRFAVADNGIGIDPATSVRSSAFSAASMDGIVTKAAGSGSPSATKSSTGTADASGSNPVKAQARRSFSHSRLPPPPRFAAPNRNSGVTTHRPAVPHTDM